MITRNSEDLGYCFDAVIAEIQSSLKQVQILNKKSKVISTNIPKSSTKNRRKASVNAKTSVCSSECDDYLEKETFDDIHRLVDEATALKKFSSIIDSAISNTRKNLFNFNIDIFRKQIGKLPEKQSKPLTAKNLFTDVTLDFLSDGKNPQEESYCFCNFSAYGRMVSCDNRFCRVKWFHFNCVGLKEEPKCLWFCSKACLEMS